MSKIASLVRPGALLKRTDGLKLILVGGILLRIVVFACLSPENNDNHLGVIRFIIEHGVPPTSDQMGQAYHPPLYYLLAVPWAMTGSAKVVQLFSLLLSVCNLCLLYRLVRQTCLLNGGSKPHALALVAILPQFVVFGNFISNDTLSYLVGTLVFAQALAYVERPTRGQLLLLGLALGAGLLTKGTFVAFAPVLLLLVVAMGLRQRFTLKQHAVVVALFCVVAGVVGSYKFIENTIHLGRPVIHNLDFDPYWKQTQSGTYQGLKSIVDVNVLTLVRHPYISKHTWHSLPLLMYGTFWYSHIPESSFIAIRDMPLDALPGAIYLAGLLPTLLMALGMAACLWRNRSLSNSFHSPDEEFVPRTQEKMSLLLLIANLALVLAAGMKQDVWSCFQGRLLFPSLFGIVHLYGAGIETVCRWRPSVRPVLNGLLALVYVLLGAYFAIEVGCAVWPVCIGG